MSTLTLSAANNVSSAKRAAQQAQIDPTVLLHELQQQVGALQKQVDALKTHLAAMQPQVEILIGHSHEVTIPTWGGLTFLNVKEYVLSQKGLTLTTAWSMAGLDRPIRAPNAGKTVRYRPAGRRERSFSSLQLARRHFHLAPGP
jgi:hypothetical protein